MKKLLLIIGLCFTISTLRAAGYIMPNDIPTTESLIELHKTLAKWEESSMTQRTESFGTQTTVTDRTKKFYEVRDALNTKLEAGHQWLVLAGGISKLTLSSINLLKEWKAFTEYNIKYAPHKPEILFQYGECIYLVSKKVSLIKKQIATLAASNFNLIYCTMKERMALMWDIQAEIEQIRGIISNHYWWSRCIVMGGIHYDFIWDILNSKVLDGIAKDVISRWNDSNASI